MSSTPDTPDTPAQIVTACLDLLSDDELRGLMAQVDPRSTDPAVVVVARCLLNEALARNLGPARLRAVLRWRNTSPAHDNERP